MKKLLLLLCAGLSGAAFAANGVSVTFHLNYPDAGTLAPVTVSAGNALPLAAKPHPERAGFRFGGWYTSAECLPSEEWLFGTNSVGFYTQPTDSMAVEADMDLYAKWIAPTPVRTAEDLDAMRQDLKGWYVLENDIDLSGIANWDPVGRYEAHYEFAPGEWWTQAFQGCLDGKGHTIRGLSLTQLLTDKSGLFGACANCEIRDVNMEGTRIVLTAERPYVGPLAGILKQDDGCQAVIRRCHVTGTRLEVKTTNSEGTFHSFTGLCGGAWGGLIEDCTATGSMDLDLCGAGGGELYVGPFLGEAYNDTVGCESDFDIRIRFSTPAANGLKAFIGGLQASATHVVSCTAKGRIEVSGNPGSPEIYIGGLVGSERYGSVEDCGSAVEIVETGLPSVQVGGIIGEFNQSYGMIGAAFGTKATELLRCAFTGRIRLDGAGTEVFGEINGGGKPEPLSSPWGISMDYKITDCRYDPQR